MYLQTLIFPIVFCISVGLHPDSYAWQIGSDWGRATGYIEEKHTEWQEVFEVFGVNAVECEAIIFPEQLRFSRLQDCLEQAAMLGLYVMGGKEKANFSIGVFQMKPSFAEQVEASWMKSELRHEYQLYFDLTDNREQRKRRLERITDKRWQCVYLALFVRLLDERLPLLKKFSGEERIRLLATAYNYSFTASLEELQQNKKRKTFHLDLFPTKQTEYYEYAGIAAEWYNSKNN